MNNGKAILSACIVLIYKLKYYKIGMGVDINRSRYILRILYILLENSFSSDDAV